MVHVSREDVLRNRWRVDGDMVYWDIRPRLYLDWVSGFPGQGGHDMGLCCFWERILQIILCVRPVSFISPFLCVSVSPHSIITLLVSVLLLFFLSQFSSYSSLSLSDSTFQFLLIWTRVKRCHISMTKLDLSYSLQGWQVPWTDTSTSSTGFEGMEGYVKLYL